SKEWCGDRGQPARIEDGSFGSGIELGQCLGKRPVGSCALKPVIIGSEPRLSRMQLIDAVEQYGRSALGCDIDQTASPFLASSPVDQSGRGPMIVLAHLMLRGMRRLRPGHPQESLQVAAD